MEIWQLILSSAVTIKLLDIAWDWWKSRKDPMKQAVRALLRSHILKWCEQCIQDGEITHRHWETLYDLYVKYKALGGNGFIAEEISTVSELPRV